MSIFCLQQIVVRCGRDREILWLVLLVVFEQQYFFLDWSDTHCPTPGCNIWNMDMKMYNTSWWDMIFIRLAFASIPIHFESFLQAFPICLFQFSWASTCTPQEFDDVHPVSFLIMYHSIYTINNFIPLDEYHIMGLRYILWKFIVA